MTDRISEERRSALMRAVPTRNTTPELIVRRLLSRCGYRYRLHRKDLPGSPDIVFPGRKKVIFVNGCFWHSHRGCPKGRPPKSRIDYWKPKLRTNQSRDRRNARLLKSMLWDVLVVWQCETKRPQSLLAKMEQFLGPV